MTSATKRTAEHSSRTWFIGLLPLGLLLTVVLVFGNLYFSPVFEDLDNRIFGDQGDGYFNLWILEHNSSQFQSGDLAPILDGRIFYPDEKKACCFLTVSLFPHCFIGR